MTRSRPSAYFICAQCKKIRNDQGYWTQLESYVAEHTSAPSPGDQPQLRRGLYPEAMDRMRKRTETCCMNDPSGIRC